MSQNRQEDQDAARGNSQPQDNKSDQKIQEQGSQANIQVNSKDQEREPLNQLNEVYGDMKQGAQVIDTRAQAGFKQVDARLGFLGSPVQLSQQNSLLVLAAQIIASTFLSLLISQITPLKWLWDLLPFLDYLSITLFFGCLIVVQFFKGILGHPYSLIFFFLHSVSKIFLITYLAVWFEDLRIEVFLVDVIMLVGYILLNIYVSSQNGTTANLTIKGNFIKLVVYSVIVSLFLVLFTRSNYWVWIALNVFSLFYAFFLLLSMQRFPEHKYLQEETSDFYLGAGQLDADLFLPFAFIRYIVTGLKNDEL